MTATIHHGDCLDVLRAMPDNSVDAIVCDPPYGLSNTSPDKVTETIVRWAQGDREYVPQGRGFMSQTWDAFVPPVAVWDECLRVLKPGGHLVAFAGSRTQDLMGIAIRLAGFDVRDTLMWVYGSGMPKSLNVSKAIDKLDAVDERLARAREFQAWLREHLTPKQVNDLTGTDMGHHLTTHPSQPAVATADLFDNLRPHLPEVPARIEELVAQRTVESQNFKAREVVGIRKGINTRTSRVGFAGPAYGGDSSTHEFEDTKAHTSEAAKWEGWGTSLKPSNEPVILARKPLSEKTVAANTLTWGTGGLNIDATRIGIDQAERAVIDKRSGSATASGEWGTIQNRAQGETFKSHAAGRWPANVVLDPDTAKALDQQSGTSKSKASAGRQTPKTSTSAYGDFAGTDKVAGHDDEGGASRFFKVVEPDPPFMYAAKAPKKERPRYEDEQGNVIQHPTCKPLSIMKWLIRLTCPEGGTVLDPFAGSGTTVEAAILEGFHVIGIEREEAYLPLIQQRIDRATPQPPEPADDLLGLLGDAA